MRLLVVEDDPKIAAFLQQGLEEIGYGVDVARDGEAGLLRALSGRYDLIVLDLLLPKLDGVEAARRLRASGAATPILVHHAGQVVTRELLAETVWGESTVESNVIDVYVRYLRQKVEAPFGAPLIRTVRGLGYTLRAA